MSDQYMNVSSTKIAIVEALLSAGLLYTASKTDSKASKVVAAATAAYLLYGAYLNTQGRVKILKDNSQGQ